MSGAGTWGPLEGTLLELRVAPLPASLVVLRHAVGGLAVGLGFDASTAADLRLAVTEVCSGWIQMEADALVPRTGPRVVCVVADLVPGALRVRMSDRAAPPAAPGTGPPLGLLAALCHTVELRGMTGGGTEVTMTFGDGETPADKG